MIDQLIIGDKASFDDFGASVAKRVKKQPKKKVIKETVPFSNITYDFTKINGEIYWEERELEYIFEMIASTPEELEDMKTAFSNWLMNIIEEELHDPLIPNYHFIATYDDMSFEDDDGMEKTTATVTFSAYPYKIADQPKVYEFELIGNMLFPHTVTLFNESSHRITPTITTDNDLWILVGFTSYNLSAGTTTSESFKLNPGQNTLQLKHSKSTPCKVSIIFYEEVF